MLTRIGGPTHTQNVYNILKSTFAKSVVAKFRLTDATGKVGLKETILAKAIRGKFIYQFYYLFRIESILKYSFTI